MELLSFNKSVWTHIYFEYDHSFIRVIFFEGEKWLRFRTASLLVQPVQPAMEAQTQHLSTDPVESL